MGGEVAQVSSWEMDGQTEIFFCFLLLLDYLRNYCSGEISHDGTPDFYDNLCPDFPTFVS